MALSIDTRAKKAFQTICRNEYEIHILSFERQNMNVIFLTVIGIAILGGNFVQFNVFGISMFYIVILLSILTMLINVCVKTRGGNQSFKLQKSEMILLGLVLYALFRVVLSYLGATDFLVSENLSINTGYILRQAYYLLFFALLVTINGRDKPIFVLKILKKYGYFIFFFVYIVSIIRGKSLALNVSTTFFLGFLSILLAKERFPLTAVIVLLSPLPGDGELTVIFIKALYLLCIVRRLDKMRVYNLLKKFFYVFIPACFILPLFSKSLSNIFDQNSIWRMEYWYDEICELKNSFFMGVGYGTSYASSNFVDLSSSYANRPFASNGTYSFYDNIYVVGSHNSIIALTFRLGILGCVLLLMYLIEKAKNIVHDNEVDNCKLYLFFSSLFIITVNVGFESPYYLLIFIISMYMCGFSQNIKSAIKN